MIGLQSVRRIFFPFYFFFDFDLSIKFSTLAYHINNGRDVLETLDIDHIFNNSIGSFKVYGPP